MPTFLYEALDKGGKQVKGVIDAHNDEIIVEKLTNMGYFPLRVVLHKPKLQEFDILSLPLLRNIFHRIRFKHIVTFTRQLATLINAGVPIVRSLTILQEQTESFMFRLKIKEMIEDIESGAPLSEAMARHPKIFDSLYVCMVRAGEIGGVLEDVLERIAGFMERRQALKSKIKSAMMYPSVIMLIASGIVTYILLDIVPRFAAIFDQLDAKLPVPTQMLLHASNILLHRGVWVVAGLAFLFFMIVKINRTKPGKYMFDWIKLRIPGVGELFRKVAISRFATTLSTLINAGVPILQSLDIVRDTTGNEVIGRAMEKVYESVREGETIHAPLASLKIFPPLLIHMVAIGEETGAIDHMLTKVAEAYDREVNDMVNAFTSVIEPLLMVMLGVIIGIVVVALYYPYFVLPGIIGQL
ncbi:type II secretion system F family protein [Candidatus Sumerlaeota bacterium]|nr:type II secretion system F family protein [Candidatus Sumerlaeota bacterium]